MALAPSAAEQELESLTQFLYMAPIGLVQASSDGEILLINPRSAQLLMPLAPGGELTNLFDVLEGIAPDLPLRARSQEAPCGPVCENLQLRIEGGVPGRAEPQVLSLTLLKLEAARLMAVVDDISAALRRDEALRRSRSWIHSFLAGTDRYALLPLDRQGRVTAWNAGVGAVTGFDEQRILGQSHALFHADAAPSAQASLERADREGWSLDDGWHQRADGSRYWGSSLVVPAAAPGQGGAAQPAYNLVIRDSTVERDADAPPRREVPSLSNPR